jgi:hypothetical protein
MNAQRICTQKISHHTLRKHYTYTPKEGVFDGTWKLPDVEAVK